jgi:hypothetical protein
MKAPEIKPRILTGLGVTATCIALSVVAIQKTRPVENAGPFSRTESAFIVSEDGKTEISRMRIDNEGNLIQTKGKIENVIGRIQDNGKEGFTTTVKGEPTMRCLEADSESAVCGSKRFQKPLGKFQFDRKIPFVIDEQVMGSFADPGGGSATTTGTVMFRSEDSTFWMKSEKVSTFTFTSPTQFKITWKTPLIYADGSNRGHVLNMPWITRMATCTINKEIQESIICNGSTPVYGKSYSAIWKFVDSKDAENTVGGAKETKTIMDSHD